tara:strand:- start:863 stop:1069 length:207 start_codon:yes stop_codon:yes gene_type:complete
MFFNSVFYGLEIGFFWHIFRFFLVWCLVAEGLSIQSFLSKVSFPGVTARVHKSAFRVHEMNFWLSDYG